MANIEANECSLILGPVKAALPLLLAKLLVFVRIATNCSKWFPKYPPPSNAIALLGNAVDHRARYSHCRRSHQRDLPCEVEQPQKSSSSPCDSGLRQRTPRLPHIHRWRRWSFKILPARSFIWPTEGTF